MRSLHCSRRLLSGTAVAVATLLTTLTPAVAANDPAADATKKARVAVLLSRIAVTGVSMDSGNEAAIAQHYRFLDTLKEEFPEVAKGVPDPRYLKVSVDEAVVSEEGEAVSAETGKPLSAAELAEIEPPADAQLSDPSEEQETPEETDVDLEAPALKSAGVGAARVSGGKWKMTHITYTHRSYLGSTIFKYHTYARFNYKGGKVRAWGKRYDRFSNEQDVVDTGSRIENRKSRVPASSATSMMKRKVKLQVPVYGDYANVYPWAKVKVYGTGKTKVAGSGA
ncbi:hypothetical protein [Streptomyces sp. NPDC002853]